MSSVALSTRTAPGRRRARTASGVRFVILGLGAVAVIAAGAIAIVDFLYRQEVRAEVGEMFARSASPARGGAGAVTEADLAPLPEPVQRWLRYSGVVGKERVTAIRLKMKGTMRQGADQPWFPIEAEEYYTTNPPALIWSATAKPAPVMWMRIKDNYSEGRGGLTVKLLSAITVADAHGEGIDQGTLLRYLNEIMWFPSAALSDYIRWEPFDRQSAKATMTYGGISASAVFVFDDEGKLTNMIAEKRYQDATATYDRWETPISAYGEFSGVKIATKGEAIWKLDAGDLSYGRLEIVDVEYNKPSAY